MATTIQVQDDTIELLKSLRANFQTATYDETIKRLYLKASGKSMYGTLGKKSLKGILKGLRDKDDR